MIAGMVSCDKDGDNSGNKVDSRIYGAWNVVKEELSWNDGEFEDETYIYNSGEYQMYFGKNGLFKTNRYGFIQQVGTWSMNKDVLNVRMDDDDNLEFIIDGKMKFINDSRLVIEAGAGEDYDADHYVYTMEKVDISLPQGWDELEDDPSQNIAGKWNIYGMKYQDFGFSDISSYQYQDEFKADGGFKRYWSGSVKYDGLTYTRHGHDIVIINGKSYNILKVTEDRMMLGGEFEYGYATCYYYRGFLE